MNKYQIMNKYKKLARKNVEEIAREITQELFSCRIVNQNFFKQSEIQKIVLDKLTELND